MMYSLFFEHCLLPLIEWKYQMPLRRQLCFLEESQWWSFRELREYQDSHLRKLVNHAYHNVEHYQNIFRFHGLRPSDIETVDDLSKLPLLAKRDVQKNTKLFVSKDISSRSYKQNRTGGSTGEPLQFYIDWEAWSMSWACTYFSWRLGGYKYGDKIANLGSYHLFKDSRMSLRDRMRLQLERNLVLSVVRMTSEKMKDYVIQLTKHNPKYVRGYPSALSILAYFIKENNITSIKPDAVFTTAETLHSHHREIIQNVFQCPIFDSYGCGDGGGSACECPEHNGHHVMMQRSIMEFVDDEGMPVSPGQRGHIVVTDLHNYCMPFIRYKLDDSAVLTNLNCDCKRVLPLVHELRGKVADTICFGDGTTMAVPSISMIFKEFSVQQFQIVQRESNNLLIKIVRGNKYTSEDDKRILETMQYHVGLSVSVDLEYVQDIPAIGTGKRLAVVKLF